MSIKSYLDYNGLRRVLTKLLPGHRKIWHGDWKDWEALSAAEKAEYDQAELTGDFDYKQIVDTVVANTENQVTSNAVNTKYNDKIGMLYNSNEFQGTLNNWQNNIPVTIPSVPKGKYLVVGTVRNDRCAILHLASSSTGILRSVFSLSNSSCTGDTYPNQSIIGYYEQSTDGNAIILCNVYSQSVTGRIAIAQIKLLRID